MLFGKLSIIGGALLAALTSWPATAIDISPLTYGPCLGMPACRIGQAELIAEPREDDARLAEQIDRSRGSVAGLGVAHDGGNGFNNPEIQGALREAGREAGSRHGGERLVVIFDAPHVVTSVIVAHLFNPDTVPGDAAEVALMAGFRDGRSLGVVRLASRPGGQWAVSGPVNAVVGIAPQAGAAMLMGPFHGAPIDRLVFSAPAVDGQDSSDYSLARITGHPAQ